MTAKRLFIVDAFAPKPFSGNPAGVLFLDDDPFPSDSVLLRVAQEVNLAETAFFRRLPGKGHYHLRWFTPQNEINLCGHATLASAFVAFTCLGRSEIEGIDNNTLLFESLSGPLSVRRVKDGPYPLTLELDFPAWSLDSCLDIPTALLAGLGLSNENNRPLYVGKNRDYLIVLPSPQAVLDVVPNFAVLAEVKDAVVIIIAAAGDGEIHPSEGSARGVFGEVAPDFVVRAFCPDCTSVPEDPVCGSAHCSLIPYFANVLKRNKMLSHQVSRRGGQLMVELSEGGERVKIAGTATLFMSGVTDCVVEG
jgi:PhzF family phenazine biosynthesis protein